MWRFLPEILAFLVCCVFLFTKSESIHWHLSDENIYYYLAKSLALDNLPYRDFFYANPPLLLFLLKSSGALFDWGPAGMRVVPIGATLVSASLLFRLFRPALGSSALIPIGCFLFSDIALRAGTHATGINVTLMFVLSAYASALAGRPKCAGLLFALGFWTKFYAVAALPGLLAAILFASSARRTRAALEFLGVFAAGGALLALSGSLVGGMAFWEMNLFYHLAKPERAGTGFAEAFARVFDRNLMTFWILAACVALASISTVAVQVVRGTSPFSGSARVWTWVGGIHLFAVLLFLIPQSRIFDFYFLLFLPGALLLSAGCLEIAKGCVARTRLRYGMEAALLAATLFLLAQPLVPYEWRFLMKQGTGAPVPYWDHERRRQDRLAEWARELDLPPGATLCGDSATAPVFALAADRKLALGEADTNAMRFRAGFPSAEEFIRRLEEARVDYLLVRTERRPGRGEALSGMFLVPEFQEYLRDSFEPVAMIETDSRTTLRLLGRKAETG